MFQHMHGGLEWIDELFAPGSIHEEIHDQAAKSSHQRAGFGITVAVAGRIGLDVSFLRTLGGRNSHQIDGMRIGTTWSFGGGDGVIRGK